jgi:hypothetical protein
VDLDYAILFHTISIDLIIGRLDFLFVFVILFKRDCLFVDVSNEKREPMEQIL